MSTIFCQRVDDFLPEYQAHLLEMLSDLVTVLDGNNLSWWLESGSLLGLIRHNGFIPWDDDLDIGMCRGDYNKLIDIIKTDEKFKEKYQLITEQDNYTYWGFAKIQSNKYIILDKHEEVYGQKIGAFIDVFPFDEVNKSWISSFFYAKKKKHFGVTKRIFKTISAYSIYKYLKSRLFLTFYSFITHLIELVLPQNGLFLLRSRYTVIHDKSDVIQAKNDKWGEIDVKIPCNSHNYLVNLFGDNYMQPPPVTNRRSHALMIVRNF